MNLSICHYSSQSLAVIKSRSIVFVKTIIEYNQ